MLGGQPALSFRPRDPDVAEDSGINKALPMVGMSIQVKSHPLATSGSIQRRKQFLNSLFGPPRDARADRKRCAIVTLNEFVRAGAYA